MVRRQLKNLFDWGCHVQAPVLMAHNTKIVAVTDQALHRPLADAIEMTTNLIKNHGLVGWRVKLDHARRRAGQCDYNTKMISLSRHYVRNADAEHVRDTILHEIAHALVGPNHGHDAVWRQKAREIGCTATRCHNLNFSKARWQMKCPNGCFLIERHRRKFGLVCAKCKAPVQFFSNDQDL